MRNYPLIVEGKLRKMTIPERNAFESEFNRRKKSVLVGYLLLILLGWHYAYVRKWGSQLLCFVTLWGLLIWWLIDWFRIPSIIRRYNDDLAVKIMTEMSIIYGNRNENNE